MVDRKRLAGRRGLLTGFTVTAGVLVMSSVAWACTASTGTPADEFIHAIHCIIDDTSHPDCPQDPSAAPDEAVVGFVAQGSGPLYPGKVVDVYQDDDDTNAQPGAFQSAIGGCDGGDPVRGTLTYGQQTVGNRRVGTGTGVLVATDGPGLYGICAGPALDVSALGQFIFL